MTIHWKLALEEHFLIVPVLNFLFKHFREKNAFSENFSKKTSEELGLEVVSWFSSTICRPLVWFTGDSFSCTLC
jgi:hypothetical protein